MRANGTALYTKVLLLPALVTGLATAAPLESAAQSREAPLSSIDWLSDSLAEETALRPLPRAPQLALGGVRVEPVTVVPLDGAAPDGVGLTGPAVSGLPADLWGNGTTDGIAERLSAFPLDALPAARDGFEQIVTARLDPPRGGGTPGVLLLARIDALLALGALDRADALIRAAGAERPDLFRRAFDIALLQGAEDTGCARLAESPGIAPSLPVRIFCLARSGDWSAAALTLETADALGQLTALEDALLARFLDPVLAEGVPPLARMPAPTPLEWRMLEAIGERQPTAGLPRAFAHADLRETAGWKTRIEAVERLVRAGALPASRLCAVYGERAAAASGGVWDRVRSIQALEAAMASGDDAAVSEALLTAAEVMEPAGLGLAFAEMIAPRLAPFTLSGRAEDVAYRLALLSPAYRDTARSESSARLALATALARGEDPAPLLDRATGRERALIRAFADDAFDASVPPPAHIQALTAAGRDGEALLEALRIMSRGAERDPEDLAGAMVALRRAGMDETARRAAIQILLLEGAP